MQAAQCAASGTVVERKVLPVSANTISSTISLFGDSYDFGAVYRDLSAKYKTISIITRSFTGFTPIL